MLGFPAHKSVVCNHFYMVKNEVTDHSKKFLFDSLAARQRIPLLSQLVLKQLFPRRSSYQCHDLSSWCEGLSLLVLSEYQKSGCK